MAKKPKDPPHEVRYKIEGLSTKEAIAKALKVKPAEKKKRKPKASP